MLEALLLMFHYLIYLYLHTTAVLLAIPFVSGLYMRSYLIKLPESKQKPNLMRCARYLILSEFVALGTAAVNPNLGLLGLVLLIPAMLYYRKADQSGELKDDVGWRWRRRKQGSV